MAIASRDPDRADQLKSKLADTPWVKVAQFAAFCCQTDALSLKLWDTPPCYGDVDGCTSPSARHLLERMLVL
jgi:hypothetical protein